MQDPYGSNKKSIRERIGRDARSDIGMVCHQSGLLGLRQVVVALFPISPASALRSRISPISNSFNWFWMEPLLARVVMQNQGSHQTGRPTRQESRRLRYVNRSDTLPAATRISAVGRVTGQSESLPFSARLQSVCWISWDCLAASPQIDEPKCPESPSVALK